MRPTLDGKCTDPQTLVMNEGVLGGRSMVSVFVNCLRIIDWVFRPKWLNMLPLMQVGLEVSSNNLGGTIWGTSNNWQLFVVFLHEDIH